MKPTWRREDYGYAAATVAAAALVAFLVAGNFGLVPSPITVRTAGDHRPPGVAPGQVVPVEEGAPVQPEADTEPVGAPDEFPVPPLRPEDDPLPGVDAPDDPDEGSEEEDEEEGSPGLLGAVADVLGNLLGGG
jgi:hypothetical protein